MIRAVTINCSELKLALAVAAEVTKKGLPFKRAPFALGLHGMQFLYTKESA
jgi:hypothetical protein